jgi:hypothetical protein
MCRYCSTDEEVQTYGCPFKYCDKTALCRSCAADRPEDRTKSGHRAKGCEREAASARAARAERKALTDCGHYVYAASRPASDAVTHAVFRSGEEKRGVYLTDEAAATLNGRRNVTLAKLSSELGYTPPEAPPDFDSPDCPSALAAAMIFFTRPTRTGLTPEPQGLSQSQPTMFA